MTTKTVTPATYITLAREIHPEWLHAVFTTAVEGGIGYWSATSGYRWSVGDGKTEDWTGFTATIQELDDDGEPGPRMPLNADVIRKGIAKAAAVAGEYGGYQQAAIRGLLHATKSVAGERGDVDFDADTADLIVQHALFGEQVYA